MRKTLTAGVLLAAISVLAVAAPASAQGRTTTIQYVGTTGTWSPADPGVQVNAQVDGEPINGTLTGYFEPVGGVLPPWPGCAPGQGVMTVASRSGTLTMTLTGDVCRSVSPAGYLIFKGWHQAVAYGRSNEHGPSRSPATGQGSFDLRLLTDGSMTFFVDGQLETSRR